MVHKNHPTAMFHAFAAARVVLPPKPVSKDGKPLVGAAKAAFLRKHTDVTKDLYVFAGRIVEAMHRYLKGASRRPSKGWDARLSYRTYKALVAKGVLQ